MALYIVSYDLRKPGQDYSSLTNVLEKMGAKKVLRSQWALRHNDTTAAKLRNHFKKFIDSNDRLLVTQPDEYWASYNTMIDINDV